MERAQSCAQAGISKQAQALFDSVMKLPIAERAALADPLMRALDEEPLTDAEIDATAERWAPEIRRRLAELESGAVQGIPWEEVDADIRQIVGESRGLRSARPGRRRGRGALLSAPAPQGRRPLPFTLRDRLRFQIRQFHPSQYRRPVATRRMLARADRAFPRTLFSRVGPILGRLEKGVCVRGSQRSWEGPSREVRTRRGHSQGKSVQRLLCKAPLPRYCAVMLKYLASG